MQSSFRFFLSCTFRFCLQEEEIFYRDPFIYIKEKHISCIPHILPFLIESPEPKASKAESISLQYTCLILSSASVRSAIIRITFHVIAYIDCIYYAI